jgi:surface antigen
LVGLAILRREVLRQLTRLRWPCVVSVAVAVVVLAGAAPAERASGTPERRLSIYGYPYARSCPAAGIAERIDRWRMYVCNCTSYVAWALQANGERTDWFIPGAMDASNWPRVAMLAGLREGSRPRAGAVAVWPKLFRPFGHVGFVTEVNGDGSFDVSEYNFPAASGFVHFLFDTRDDVPAHGVVFLYVPRRA